MHANPKINKKSVSLKIPDKLAMIFRFQASPVGYTFGKAVKNPTHDKKFPQMESSGQS